MLEAPCQRCDTRRKSILAVAARTVEGVGEIDMSGVHEVNREAVTRIVDKVQAQGLASLTAQEKSFLRAFLPMDEPRRRG